MRAGIYGKTSFGELQAFAEGAARLGYEPVWQRHSVFTPDQVEDFDLVATRGARLHSAAVRDAYMGRGVPVVVVDLPPIRTLESQWALWPGFVNRLPASSCPHDRLGAVNFNQAPLGEGVLICGQTAGDAAHGLDRTSLARWYERVVGHIKRSGRRAVFRPHPQNPMSAPGADLQDPAERSYTEVIGDGWAAVVCINSTCGLEALARGIPVFCDESSFYIEAAQPIDEMDSPRRPDPEAVRELFARLSYSQWTPDEIRDGEPIQMTLERMPRSCAVAA